jgi:hypothetical protein
MAKSKTVRVTEEELQALKHFRELAKMPTDAEVAAKAATPVQTASEAQQALADAFVSAIERTRPPAKITIANRKPQTPWTPPAGVPRVKLKRKMYHHGLPIEERVTNEDLDLLNKLRPGVYCDGYVRVTLRKDRGLDIDYPVRTSSQRLKLVNTYGIRSFTELLQRLIAEKAEPAKYRKPDDADLYDLET